MSSIHVPVYITALEESVPEEDDEMPAEWESHYFGANESNTSQFSGKKRGNFRKVYLFICKLLLTE